MNDETSAENSESEPQPVPKGEPDTSDVQPQPSEKNRNHLGRRRKRRWHFGFWMVVWLVLGASFFWLVSLSITGRTVQLPDWAVVRLEERLNQDMPNGSITVQYVEFSVSPAGFPGLSLVDMQLRDNTGLEIAQIHRVQGAAHPVALLMGRIAPSRLSLSGALVTVRRRVNGEFDLSFGQKSGASGDLAAVLDAIDEMFAQGPLSRAEEIEADELTITLEDARTGRVWQVTDGRLKLNQDDKFVDMTLAFDVFNQTDELAEMVLSFRTDKSSSEASFGAAFKNAAAADIAAQTPLLAFLSVIDAPISGALRSSIDTQGKVSDLAGTLEIGAGALSPSSGAKPVNFDLVKVYIDYDPTSERIEFTDFSVLSDYGKVNGEGHIYPRDLVNGWPTSLLGQFHLAHAEINAPELFSVPVRLDNGAIDFRLHLNPFTMEIGELVLDQRGTTIKISGQVAASQDGWSLALDGETPHLSPEQVVEFWPVAASARSREWIENKLLGGMLSNLNASIRLNAGENPRLSFGAGFHGVDMLAVREMAPILDAHGYMSITDTSFLVVAEGGHIPAASGRDVDITGTVYRVPDMLVKPAPAVVELRAEGALTDVLSILGAAPFNALKNTDFGPDLATGHVVAQGRADVLLQPNIQPEDVTYSVSAVASDVRSAVLVPDRVLSADSLSITADNRHLEITGDMRLGQATGRGTWFANIGPDVNGASRLEARVALDQAFIDEFNIKLPENSLSGQGIGQLSVDFAPDQAPQFELVSDLNRLAIAIPSLSWSKPQNRTGSLRIAGRLSDPPVISDLEFSATGLEANGHVTIKPDGGLDQAVFSRVKLGGWLDAPVTFTGRGPDREAAITISGGSVDMRRAQFSGSSGTVGAGNSDAPIHLALDRLAITEGIALTNLTGELDRQGGLSGQFSALVNGGPPIQGVIAAQENGSAVRITSDDAGGVLNAAGVFETTRGGGLTLILAPHAAKGTYDGDLTITDTRMVGASGLAELLSAISIVGLLEQLTEEGIAFSNVDARFRLTPEKVIISSASATGASIGVSLDGTYMMESGIMDLSGVLSPLYILNGFGQVFTRRGEGLIGFTYTMTGTTDDPEIVVNPLSLFTPAMFREIFRRPPPELSE